MAQFTDEMKRKMPEPVFGCACCFEDFSRPADELRWSEEDGNWLCESCADQMGVRLSRFTLADMQKEIGFLPPDQPTVKAE